MKKDKNNNTVKISFVIPVFNSQGYLRKCVDSILIQGGREIEIILINDGSTDNSGKICDEYCSKFNFIKVVHKENEGVAIARNIGIEKSVGNYVFFVDNDDWVAEGSVRSIISIINKKEVDLIINKYYIVNKEKIGLGNFLINKKKINNQEVDRVLGYFRKNRINIMAPWKYVVRRDIIVRNNIFFNSSQNGVDDSVFSSILFCHCRSFYLNDYPTYYWRQITSSQGRNHDKNNFMKKIFSTFYSFSEFLEKSSDENKKRYIYFCIYKNIFSLFQFYKYYSQSEKNEIRFFLIKNKKIIRKSSRNSGPVHFLLFNLLGSFYGMLLGYNFAKIKGIFHRFIFKLK